MFKLPYEILTAVLQPESLSTTDIVRCRRVCRSWNASLDDDELSFDILKWHYPQCRELRLWRHVLEGVGEKSSTKDFEDDSHVFHQLSQQAQEALVELVSFSQGTEHDDGESAEVDELDGGWLLTRDLLPALTDVRWSRLFKLVARRYHHLRSAQPYCTEKVATRKAGEWRELTPYLRTNESRNAAFPVPTWSYDQEDALLVYWARPRDGPEVDHTWTAIRMLDVATGVDYAVPFLPGHVTIEDHEEMVGSIRVKHRMLVIDYWVRNGRELIEKQTGELYHRVVVYDLIRRRNGQVSQKPPWLWEIEKRCSFKTEYYGGRKLWSAHTSTLYAAYCPCYCDQPDRPGHQPVIVLQLPSRQASESAANPICLEAISQERLDWCRRGGPQGKAWNLRDFSMTDRHVHLEEVACESETEAFWIGRDRTSHSVRHIAVPFSSGRLQPMQQLNEWWLLKSYPTHGPHWLQICEASTASGLCESTRVGRIVSSTKDVSRLVNTETRAAPCWRHDRFPQVTTAELVDFAAGVRVAARHSNLRTTLAVDIKPSLTVEIIFKPGCGNRSSANYERDPDTRYQDLALEITDNKTLKNVAAQRLRATETLDVHEAYLPDKVWNELMHGGQLAGDERWLIGEDAQSRLTILRF